VVRGIAPADFFEAPARFSGIAVDDEFGYYPRLYRDTVMRSRWEGSSPILRHVLADIKDSRIPLERERDPFRRRRMPYGTTNAGGLTPLFFG
jgi:hypothetical protein